MDAHAKNFSMLMDERAYQLAPFYDLLSTRAYPSLTPKLAMSIGGQLLVEELKSAHWEQLASEAGVAPRAVLEIVREITGTLPGVCPAVCKQFDPTPEENTMLNKLVRHITATCAGLARGLQKTS
jgi:serine/threonine-protein kinase HipA